MINYLAIHSGLGFRRTISDHRMDVIQHSKNKDEATHLGVVDTIHDVICKMFGQVTKKAVLNQLYYFTHGTDEEALSAFEALKKYGARGLQTKFNDSLISQ